MEAVWIALIVAAGAATTTLLTTWLNARQIRAGKEQDYARQDHVAAQLEARQDAAEAKAEGVAKQAAEAAKLLLASNKLVAEQSAHAAEVTNGKLAQIHDLVNSNLTAQMGEAHGALMQQLVLMREVIALHKAAGRNPSKDALDAIEVIERKIAELGAQLADRAAVTATADSKVAKQW